jgi:hypothetical protein
VTIPAFSVTAFDWSIAGTLPTAATPNFTPGSGTYAGTQNVTIASSTGATIHYTTDGSTPTISSLVYSAPIVVASAMTIQAIAGGSGFTTSSTGSAGYAITAPVTAPPAFSLASGSYTGTQTLTLSDATSGASLYYTTNGTSPTASSSLYSGAISISSSENYYTTDGSTPTTSSTVYSGPISVGASETLKTIASGGGFSSSSVGFAAYTITLPAATPTFTPAPATYFDSVSVTISDATPGAVIYYTLNRGLVPTTSSPVYTGPITLTTTSYVNAIAVASGYSNSTEAIATYSVLGPAPAVPTFSLPSGTYTGAQTVTISDATPGAVIQYTTDGSIPTHSSPVYSSPLTVSSSETIRAIANQSNHQTSTWATATYTIQ